MRATRSRWDLRQADAMVEAARLAANTHSDVRVQVCCTDGTTFTRTYHPEYGRHDDSPPTPVPHIPSP
ncbi:hypothetical protein CHO01_29010 [Cellulomonas hominis]|uniref:Uncharacterized protein n=1 Tax=Cellulomonas hominis TaxID=156981 RepID=A0A511FEV5_9CELL|nr:hypothetical protein CHO01_29010 [Cellulomonas hominis]